MQDYRDLSDVENLADSMLALFLAKAPEGTADQPVPFIDASCSRLGPSTIRATLAKYRFGPGMSFARIDGGEVGLLGPPEVWVLRHVTDNGAAPQLGAATAVLSCGFALPFDGPLTFAEWAALSDGLQTRFADAEFMSDPEADRALGVAEGS